jgi:hypothetical protein
MAFHNFEDILILTTLNIKRNGNDDVDDDTN